MASKNIIQVTSGALAAIFGLIFFFYFGSRQRPHLLDTSESTELHDQAFMHDLGTVAGVLLFGAGCILLLVGAVAHWSRPEQEIQEEKN